MRTVYCGQVTSEYEGQEIDLVGWVNRRRDLGGVIFIDLRDREGIVQVVFDPDREVSFAVANTLRNEFCVKLRGKVRPRPEGQVNKDMTTGEIEVLGIELEILNRSAPVPLDSNQENSEELRLKYRYIDLRRPEMTQRLMFRSKVTSFIRRYMDDHGFLDIETPMLTKATPEGARDYLVPSRTNRGKFFALPQSPQLFKQLLMVAGMDRYYQIVKCFRDEDLRADRQPEFTQVDIETSFMTSDEVREVTEALLRNLFNQLLNVDLGDFPIMTWHEAMRLYGSDKPDLRNPMQFIDVADLLKDVEFKVFAGPANDPKGRVAMLCVPGGAQLSRKQLDEYTKYIGKYGAKGMAWMKINDASAGAEGVQSPVAKFLTADIIEALIKRANAQSGDILLFGADSYNVVCDAIGALRLKVGEDLGLVAKGWKPLWVVDFPMFEEADGRLWAMHHPFTAPVPGVTPQQLRDNPADVLSNAYDVVLNGFEIGGGSVRIHQQDMQSAAFEALGISEEEAQDKFGFLLQALQFGAPPHAGLALGLDRLVMLMTGASNIREVMAFPKTTTAGCPLTDAPSVANPEVLKELGIEVVAKDDDITQKKINVPNS